MASQRKAKTSSAFKEVKSAAIALCDVFGLFKYIELKADIAKAPIRAMPAIGVMSGKWFGNEIPGYPAGLYRQPTG